MICTEKDLRLTELTGIFRDMAEMVDAEWDIDIDLDFSIDMPAPDQTKQAICPECGHRFTV